MANLVAAERNPLVHAIVLIGNGRTFPAGADITEFGSPSQGPPLDSICEALEVSE